MHQHKAEWMPKKHHLEVNDNSLNFKQVYFSGTSRTCCTKIKLKMKPVWM